MNYRYGWFILADESQTATYMMQARVHHQGDWLPPLHKHGGINIGQTFFTNIGFPHLCSLSIHGSLLTFRFLYRDLACCEPYPVGNLETRWQFTRRSVRSRLFWVTFIFLLLKGSHCVLFFDWTCISAGINAWMDGKFKTISQVETLSTFMQQMPIFPNSGHWFSDRICTYLECWNRLSYGIIWSRHLYNSLRNLRGLNFREYQFYARFYHSYGLLKANLTEAPGYCKLKYKAIRFKNKIRSISIKWKISQEKTHLYRRVNLLVGNSQLNLKVAFLGGPGQKWMREF